MASSTSTSAKPFRLQRRKSSYTDLAENDGSSTLMTMCSTNDAYLDNFEGICSVVKDNVGKIVKDIHSKDKLLVSNGKCTVFAPPESEATDNHGNLLLRTFSEEVNEHDQCVMTREVMVHLEQGNKIEVRERRKSKTAIGTFEYKEMQKLINLD
ncbi:hypothetical protein SARC_01052 [Sphaeroforma arctica JP610]|uniref:Uncharacterized protein n=1 Tax=Sphaeroforma arctica JP610 TaxID=667725 RepID=A0A0L0GCS8_9EUKA|nr:hypothetical protein SARC_01052 [Sphaeroforma arctica JP610]KNC86820.1 hypothetical protein SARC_01052 [Sphaeroforma arctica JP610]|eukprot:XP_014160722.1 hypothetical protein SARC_01052 [Sphaeroforma arctica JP610]